MEKNNNGKIWHGVGQLRRKRLLSIVLTLSLLASIAAIPAFANTDDTPTVVKTQAVAPDEPATPINLDGASLGWDSTTTIPNTNATPYILKDGGGTGVATFEGSSSDDEFFVVLDDVNAASVIVKGGATLNLYLKPGTTNTLNAATQYIAGVDVQYNSKVNIYGTGSLIATGGGNAAGIGGVMSSTINIFNGNITATGDDYGGAGIGGSSDSYNVKVKISGGTIESATGGAYAAGIGSGWYSYDTKIEISGGNIKSATGGINAAGIGGGLDASEITIEISGDVHIGTANSVTDGAGIGSGAFGDGVRVEISGGTIESATGGAYAAGIGSAWGSSDVTVEISGTPQIKAYAKNVPAIWGDNDSLATDGKKAATIINAFVTESGIDFVAPSVSDIYTDNGQHLTLPVGYASFAYIASESTHRNWASDATFGANTQAIVKYVDNDWDLTSADYPATVADPTTTAIPVKLSSGVDNVSVTFMANDTQFGDVQYVLSGYRPTRPATDPTASAGYSFTAWDYNFATGDTVTAAKTINAGFVPRTDTAYTVQHYKVDASGTATLADTVKAAATTDTAVSATQKNYENHTFDKDYAGTSTSGNVAGDGSLVLKLYYPINRYTVTFKDYNGSTLKTETVAHGAAASAPTSPSRVGYTFTGWDRTFSNVTSEFTVNAKYEIIPPVTPGTPTIPTTPDEENVTPEVDTPDTTTSVVPEPAEPEEAAPVTAASNLTQEIKDTLSIADQAKIEAQTGNLARDLLDGNVPLGNFGAKGVWSLLNLILAFICLVGLVITLIGIFRKNEYQGIAKILRFVSAGLAAVTVIAWVVLDKLHVPTVWVDQYTATIGALFVVTAIVTIVFNMTKKNARIAEAELDA